MRYRWGARAALGPLLVIALLAIMGTPGRAAFASRLRSQEAPSASAPSDGSLIVHAQAVRGRGVPPRRSSTPQPVGLLPVGPIVGLVVQVVAADAPDAVLAEGATDASGEVAFTLPAGSYWVYAPQADALPGYPGETIGGARLPDGRLVFAYEQATLSSGTTSEITLSVALAAP